MRMRWITGLTIMAALAMVPPAIGVAASKDLHGCGDLYNELAYVIKADFSCKKAKKVVRRWDNASSPRNVRGFRCRYRKAKPNERILAGLGEFEGRVKCSTRKRDVRWITAARRARG